MLDQDPMGLQDLKDPLGLQDLQDLLDLCVLGFGAHVSAEMTEMKSCDRDLESLLRASQTPLGLQDPSSTDLSGPPGPL